MGSRYGRKKKRAHLARIAELEYEATAQAVMAQRAQNENRLTSDALANLAGQIDRWDEDIRDLLGRETALAIEPLQMVEKVEGFLREMAVYPVMRAIDPAGPLIANLAVHRMEIYRFVSELKDETLDQLKRFMRMEIRCGASPVRDPLAQHPSGGYNWNYAVSRSLFERGLAERDIIHIAEQIAVQFHRRMSDEIGRKRDAAAA